MELVLLEATPSRPAPAGGILLRKQTALFRRPGRFFAGFYPRLRPAFPCPTSPCFNLPRLAPLGPVLGSPFAMPLQSTLTPSLSWKLLYVYSLALLFPH